MGVKITITKRKGDGNMLETVYGWISAAAIVFVVGVIFAVIDTVIGGGE